MKKVIFDNGNGGMSVMHVIDQENIQNTAIKDVPLGVNFWIIDESLLPQSREFRDAWELDLSNLGSPSGIGEHVAEVENDNN